MGNEVVGAGASLLYVIVGALVGGGGAIVAALLGVRFVLNSPVIIKALEALASSFPPELKELVLGMGKLLTEIADDVPYADDEDEFDEDDDDDDDDDDDTTSSSKFTVTSNTFSKN